MGKFTGTWTCIYSHWRGNSLFESQFEITIGDYELGEPPPTEINVILPIKDTEGVEVKFWIGELDFDGTFSNGSALVTGTISIGGTSEAKEILGRVGRKGTDLQPDDMGTFTGVPKGDIYPRS